MGFVTRLLTTPYRGSPFHIPLRNVRDILERINIYHNPQSHYFLQSTEVSHTACNHINAILQDWYIDINAMGEALLRNRPIFPPPDRAMDPELQLAARRIIQRIE